IADRLARWKISEAHSPRVSLHFTFTDVRCLFCDAAHTRQHAIVRRGNGPFVVARASAAHWWPGRRDFRHALPVHATWALVRRSSAGIFTWTLGRRIDLRPFRQL